MPRRLDLGEAAEISLSPQRKDDDGEWRNAPAPQAAQRWRAQVRVRLWDGRITYVSRYARTRREAETACRARVRDVLREYGDQDIRASTTVREACDAYLTWLARPGSKTSPRTVSDYRRSYDNVIAPADSHIGSLRLSEANDTQRLRRFLQIVADERGTGTATRVKSILSGLFSHAIRSGVLDENRVKFVGSVTAATPKRSPRDLTRAMTRAERDAVVDLAQQRAITAEHLRARTSRKAWAVADQIAFLAGTGVRINESRDLTWTDIDLTSGRTLIRGTKTESAHRSLHLPPWLLERVNERHRREQTRTDYEFSHEGLVFPAPGRLTNTVPWEPSNNSSAVRRILDAAGLTWAVPHTFRRTVATLLHEAGVPLVRIADQLGHKDPLVTARVYLGRDALGDKSETAQWL